LRKRILAVLALLPFAGCPSRTDVTCGTEKVLVNGKETGIEKCSDGVLHIAQAFTTCESSLPRANHVCTPTGSGKATCTTDADCIMLSNGHCEIEHFGSDDVWCNCHDGCRSDADCASNHCVCGDPVGNCAIFAGCRTDADCPGSFCTVSSSIGESPLVACLSPDNECEIHADCSSDNCDIPRRGSRRICATPRSSCEYDPARPFLVNGSARFAEVTEREDWRGSDAPVVSGIPAVEREAIAHRWASIGLLEHASVAAFARFSLHLLSLGAPPDLVLDAQRAMADEIEHARICFAIASAHADRPLGPGPLAIEDALHGSSPREILVTAILEGCIGETVAAIEAEEMAWHAVDPAVRHALQRIAADEARHAELVWRFVRWALQGDASLVDVARATFTGAVTSLEEVRGEPADSGLERHGITSEAQKRWIARQALMEVVQPCAEALLASCRGRAAARPPHTAPQHSQMV
jgi:hypothetical protein